MFVDDYKCLFSVCVNMCVYKCIFVCIRAYTYIYIFFVYVYIWYYSIDSFIHMHAHAYISILQGFKEHLLTWRKFAAMRRSPVNLYFQVLT